LENETDLNFLLLLKNFLAVIFDENTEGVFWKVQKKIGLFVKMRLGGEK